MIPDPGPQASPECNIDGRMNERVNWGSKIVHVLKRFVENTPILLPEHLACPRQS